MTAVLESDVSDEPVVTVDDTVETIDCWVLDKVVDCSNVVADGSDMAVFGTPWTAMNCMPRIPALLETVAVWTMSGARFAVENIQVIDLGISTFVADACWTSFPSIDNTEAPVSSLYARIWPPHTPMDVPVRY